MNFGRHKRFQKVYREDHFEGQWIESASELSGIGLGEAKAYQKATRRVIRPNIIPIRIKFGEGKWKAKGILIHVSLFPTEVISSSKYTSLTPIYLSWLVLRSFKRNPSYFNLATGKWKTKLKDGKYRWHINSVSYFSIGLNGESFIPGQSYSVYTSTFSTPRRTIYFALKRVKPKQAGEN